jgi:hypothetical protein
VTAWPRNKSKADSPSMQLKLSAMLQPLLVTSLGVIKLRPNRPGPDHGDDTNSLNHSKRPDQVCLGKLLARQPPISKPIKNFQPDTGIPSLRTLIEYKYVESKEDVRRVVDEVLADTRGYSSKKWDRFIYVIYETARIKLEAEWRQMLRENDVPESTEIIVICGEAARSHSRLASPGKNRKSVGPKRNPASKVLDRLPARPRFATSRSR